MPKLMLDYVYGHAESIPEHVFLVQPVGGGRVVHYTWADVLDQARRMAAHLRSRGLEPGARVAMLSKNTAHFFIAELAVWMAGATTVAIFPTERADNIRYVLEHSGASLLFVGKLDAWGDQARAVPAGLPCIAMPLAAPTDFESWDSIASRTDPLGGRPARDPNDLAMLLYTSGSTGQPKGVKQTFGTVTRVTELRAAATVDQGLLPAHIERRFLSYLPLAHVYERAAIECAALLEGHGRIFFSESLATFIDDLKRARPTLFVSVPRLWLKFQQMVFQSIPEAKLDALLADPATARGVSTQVLAGLGLDQVYSAVTGSAPIAPALLAWYRRVGLNLLEGYAMTEDFCWSHLSTPGHSAPGHVGLPCPGVEVRMDPSGEILVKSPGQLAGYYKRPDLDAQSFTDDGFFRTGDVGERRADGQLKITGRVKDVFKTAKGKFVAPAPIESLLNAHPMIEQSIVAGVGQAAPFAVVVLSETLRPRLGESHFQLQVEENFRRLHEETNARLAAYERLQMLVIAREPWSIDNGCLTPTLKIKRDRIEAAFASHVDGWYERGSSVLWA